MLATTLIRLFLRIVSLWIGFLSLQRGAITFLIQDMHVVSAQWGIVLCVFFFSLALLIWFVSARLSVFIVGKDGQTTSIDWSSRDVVLSGVVLIGLYSLFIDAIPVLFDFSTRALLLWFSGQHTYLSNPSFFVPGFVLIAKIGMAIMITIKARAISSKVVGSIV